MWRNCGAGTDYLKFATLGFDWVTGGYFSLILVAVLILITYIKYHKALYPILIGIAYLPMSYFLVDPALWWYVLVLMGVAIACMIVTALLKQTKEYD